MERYFLLLIDVIKIIYPQIVNMILGHGNLNSVFLASTTYLLIVVICPVYLSCQLILSNIT